MKKKTLKSCDNSFNKSCRGKIFSLISIKKKIELKYEDRLKAIKLARKC
jgi:hypothetical protein